MKNPRPPHIHEEAVISPISKSFITVVAVALANSEGRLLLAQRPLGKHHGGLWEFPGGKIDQGELPREAVCREIREELNLILDADSLIPAGFAESEGDQSSPSILLLLYKSEIYTGNVMAMEGQEFGWFTRKQAEALDLAPMDRRLLEKL